MRLKKGDTVMVIAGKDKGKQGKIIEAFPAEDKVIVERVNVAKKHQRPSKNFQGGIIEKALPIWSAKVMLVCPKCHETTRVKKKLVDDTNRRACRKCGETVDKV